MVEFQLPNSKLILSRLNKILKEKEEREYRDVEKSEHHWNLGNELYKEGKFAEAIKEYEEAKRRNPDDPKIYNNLSAAFIKIM